MYSAASWIDLKSLCFNLSPFSITFPFFITFIEFLPFSPLETFKDGSSNSLIFLRLLFDNISTFVFFFCTFSLMLLGELFISKLISASLLLKSRLGNL